MHSSSSLLYTWLHSAGVMVPYLGISLIVFGLYLRRTRALVAQGALKRTYAVEAALILAFVPLCSAHRAFLTFAGLPQDGLLGLTILGALTLASVGSLGLLARSAARLDRFLADLFDLPQKLQDSESLLAGTLASSIDGVMAFDSVRDADGTIVDFTVRFVNPAAERVVGRSAAELVGKRLLEELPGNKETGLFDMYCRVVETGEPADSEFFYDHDGIQDWFTNTAVKRGDGFAVTFRVVTEQKAVEERMRQDAERLRLLLQITTQSDASFDTRIAEALPLATELFGLDIGILSRVEGECYTVQHVHAPDTPLAPGQQFDLGDTYCSITLASDRIVTIDHMGASEHATHPCYEGFGLEAYIGMPVRVGGEPYGTLNFSSSKPRQQPFTEADRNFVLLIGHWIAHTIEREQKDDQLRRSETSLNFAQRVAHIGSWEWDLQADAQTWSDELYRLYGLAPGDAIDPREAFVARIHPDDRARVAQELETLCMQGGPFESTFEYRIALPDGTERPVRCRCQTVPGLQGGPRAVGTVQDVTEEKRNEQLRTNFISVVSHELRTPLTSIAGSLRIAAAQADDAVPATIRGMLDIAQRNSERLVRLINDILDVQKMETGEMALYFQPESLPELLAAAVEANEGYGVQRGVGIQLGAVPDVHVRADHDRFMQVMANLLSNAIKFSPDGADVEVSATLRGDTVRVAVRDHGSGIPEDFRDQVFDRFAQADSSTTRANEGSGLGLNIAKSLVELHGGRIGFDSTYGVGTTFWVDLPAQAPVTTSSSARVLVIEDDPDVARLLQYLLGQTEIESDVAYSAEDARRLLAEHAYAAVTLDLLLPDTRELDFLQEIRHRWPDLPVVVVSAVADIQRRTLEGGALALVDWLNKPIIHDTLSDSVRQALRHVAAPRILHVEDDDDCAAVTAAALAEAGEIVRARTLAEAHVHLAGEPFDLLLLDLGLPDGEGLDLLDEPAGVTADMLPPTIVYSGQQADAWAADRALATVVKGGISSEQLLRLVTDAVASTPYRRASAA